LVDNGTVVIENIERHVTLRKPLASAIIEGAGEGGIPTTLATLCICIVFIPVFLLRGTAKYLFSPLSMSVIVSLIASLALSFTLVPVLFKFLMRNITAIHHGDGLHRSSNPLMRIHYGFNDRFERFRESYRNILAWSLSQPL